MVDQAIESVPAGNVRGRGGDLRDRHARVEEGLERDLADHLAGPQWQVDPGQAGKDSRDLRHGRIAARLEPDRDLVRLVMGLEDAVNHQLLVGDFQLLELLCRPRCFVERGDLGPADQHHRGAAGIGQCIDRRGVEIALLDQTL